MINIHTVVSQFDDPMNEMPQYVIVTQAADGSRRENRYPPNLQRAQIRRKYNCVQIFGCIFYMLISLSSIKHPRFVLVWLIILFQTPKQNITRLNTMFPHL